MTSATERLRALLDERGVEWKDYGYENHTWWGEWHAENRSSVNGLFVKVEGVVTPEQAIAATLGPGTCEVEGSTKLGFEPYFEHDLSCGHTVTSEWWEPPSFCPECGARVVC